MTEQFSNNARRSSHDGVPSKLDSMMAINAVRYHQEMNFLEMAQMIWRRKVWILVLSLGLMIFVSIFFFLKEPTVAAEAGVDLIKTVARERFNLPAISDSGAVIIDPIQVADQASIWALFSQAFEDEKVGRKEAFAAKGVIKVSLLADGSTDFSKLSRLKVAIEGVNEDSLVTEFNSFLEAVADRANQLVRDEIKSKLEERKRNLPEKIEFIRQNELEKRVQEIVTLEEKQIRKRIELGNHVAAYEAEATALRGIQIEKYREELAIKKEALEVKLLSLNNLANSRRNDRIYLLKEALEVAKRYEIEGAMVETSGERTDLDDFEKQSAGFRLYLRGVKALKAEIELLERQGPEHNSLIVPEIRSIEQQLEMQKSDPRITILRQRKQDRIFSDKILELERELAILNFNDKSLGKLKELASRPDLVNTVSPTLFALRKEERSIDGLLTSADSLAVFKSRVLTKKSSVVVKSKRIGLMVLGALCAGFLLSCLGVLLYESIKFQKQSQRAILES